ncbi:hypothetical protein EDD85DRAFT_798212 [Armillaria nabsnona]|nr:hypothetical protein EDD85DRAFT_798212 [Armillaria nabsnona]
MISPAWVSALLVILLPSHISLHFKTSPWKPSTAVQDFATTVDEAMVIFGSRKYDALEGQREVKALKRDMEDIILADEGETLRLEVGITLDPADSRAEVSAVPHASALSYQVSPKDDKTLECHGVPQSMLIRHRSCLLYCAALVPLYFFNRPTASRCNDTRKANWVWRAGVADNFTSLIPRTRWSFPSTFHTIIHVMVMQLRKNSFPSRWDRALSVFRLVKDTSLRMTCPFMKCQSHFGGDVYRVVGGHLAPEPSLPEEVSLRVFQALDRFILEELGVRLAYDTSDILGQVGKEVVLVAFLDWVIDESGHVLVKMSGVTKQAHLEMGMQHKSDGGSEKKRHPLHDCEGLHIVPMYRYLGVQTGPGTFAPQGLIPSRKGTSLKGPVMPVRELELRSWTPGEWWE